MSFADLIAALGGDPLLLHAGIILATFVLEDAATMGAALLAASDMVPVWSALLALGLGIFVGDLGLYGAGYLARHNSRLTRFIGSARIEAGSSWLRRRLVSALIAARFVPGLRLPAYTASGYLRVSFAKFAAVAAVAAGLWTTLLFSVVYAFGEVVLPVLGAWRWAAAVCVVVCVIALPHLISLFRTPTQEAVE